MIDILDGVYHIRTDRYSYLFRITSAGILEHLYFGLPVQTGDAKAFVCHPGLGWGSSVLLDDGDSGSCLDDKPLEWSSSGRGDYRESPIELCGTSADFRFAGSRTYQGIAPMNGTLPQAKGACETLEITLEQKGLRLTLIYSAFPGALVRRTVMENIGEEPVRVNKLMSMSLDLHGDYVMTTFNGGWIAEMRRQDVPVGGSKVVNESLTGASSNRHNPGFLLSEPGATEDVGVVYGFNLIYSGNHYASAQQSLQGFTRVMQGINPSNFHKVLQSGELFETPEAVLCFSEEGFGGLSRTMHRFVNDHIVPQYWQGRLRPVK